MSDLQDRALGSAGAVCVLGLVAAWVVDLPIQLKLAATGTVAGLIVATAGMAVFRKRRLQRTRLLQLERHRAGRPQSEM